jgi:hypothetical protein
MVCYMESVTIFYFYYGHYYNSTILHATITVLDFIHQPVLYLKHDVLETGLCLRLQVEPTEMGLVCLIQ